MAKNQLLPQFEVTGGFVDILCLYILFGLCVPVFIWLWVSGKKWLVFTVSILWF